MYTRILPVSNQAECAPECKRSSVRQSVYTRIQPVSNQPESVYLNNLRSPGGGEREQEIERNRRGGEEGRWSEREMEREVESVYLKDMRSSRMPRPFPSGSTPPWVKNVQGNYPQSSTGGLCLPPSREGIRGHVRAANLYEGPEWCPEWCKSLKR